MKVTDRAAGRVGRDADLLAAAVAAGTIADQVEAHEGDAGADTSSSTLSGKIRKLLAREQAMFQAHLLRLDADARRMRFAHPVSDGYILDYASRMTDMDGVVYAFIVDGEVRGVAELRKMHRVWGPEAEAAFSVEGEWRNKGIATLLMGRIIRAARNRGVRTLVMSCLVENTVMQGIARKYRADLRCDEGAVMAHILPARADYFSIMAEAIEDRVGVAMAALDLQSSWMRRGKAAH